MKTLYRLFLILFVCLTNMTGCGGGTDGPVANWSDEVEIAPGEWLRIEGREGRCWFRCRWNGKTVYWAGHYHKGQAGYYDVQFPVSLRSWNGALYLIYSQRDDEKGLSQYTYCRLAENGTAFEEIKRQDFPRQIATQNIGMHQEGIKYDENGKQVDNLKILRALDVTNRYFNNSTTGWIWYHLETGRTREELEITTKEALAFYGDFVSKYHPIALPMLDKPTK